MSDEVHGHVFDDGDVLGSVAGAQAVGKKPVEVVADPVSALFEPTMIGVDGVEDPAVWGIGGIGEEGLDLSHEGGPVGLQREQIEHRQPWRGSSRAEKWSRRLLDPDACSIDSLALQRSLL
jgi:hypothetical protein